MNFRSYWACSSSSRPHDGVGILLRYPLHKHVQTIDSWEVPYLLSLLLGWIMLDLIITMSSY
ncbi:hypothetical protein RhiirA4_491790 [Rhizophagus irregularis]|uniref:Uncharacterized protein n=1 Tax=Rhizophagus irregularis TaxID=588596 RepID=A0A2I1HWP2_9GLOM|nr:hypothetical protein RhiirA4_491790 [Rhizophagus irregularis]